MNPRIVYMGTPEFAVAPLKALLDNNFNVVGVVTVPDKPSGRGLKVNESDVKKFYKENNLEAKGVKLMQPTLLKDDEFINQLSGLDADIFIVVAFRMLPKVVWNMPKLGTFNLHGSLLPAYRGAAPINWAIINGEKVSGVTTFLIDEKIDTGNILLQKECPIEERENVGSLYSKLMNIGAGLVLETVKGLAEGSIKPHPQSGEIKDAPKLNKETGKIDWGYKYYGNERTAICLDRLIRGLSPYPCAHSVLTNDVKDIEFKIFEAEPLDIIDKTKVTGEVVSDNKKFLHIYCSDGSALSIKELQPAGKKRMKINEFLAGFRDAQTYRAI